MVSACAGQLLKLAEWQRWVWAQRTSWPISWLWRESITFLVTWQVSCSPIEGKSLEGSAADICGWGSWQHHSRGEIQISLGQSNAEALLDHRDSLPWCLPWKWRTECSHSWTHFSRHGLKEAHPHGPVLGLPVPPSLHGKRGLSGACIKGPGVSLAPAEGKTPPVCCPQAEWLPSHPLF